MIPARTIFDNTPPGKAAHSQSDVQSERAGRHRIDLDRFFVFSKPHDRAFSKSPFNLRQSGVKRLCLIHGRPFPRDGGLLELPRVFPFWHERSLGATFAAMSELYMLCS